jgi:poly(A) polymerase
MFYDPLEQRVLDFVGGQEDLRNGIVRAIGNPVERMLEDKLRLLRAVRFAATLDFQLEDTTGAAVRQMAPQISIVSVERITQELRKMLVDGHRSRAMTLCLDLGLLPVILPEALARPDENAATIAILDALRQPSFPLALAVLLRLAPNPPASRRNEQEGTVAAICRRLRLSNQESQEVVWLHAHQDDLLSAAMLSTPALKRLLAHPLIGQLAQFADAKAEVLRLDRTGLEYVRLRRAEWTADDINPSPLLTGHDILALGVKSGPRIKRLLDAVRDAQLNSEIRTQAEAVELVRRSLP